MARRWRVGGVGKDDEGDGGEMGANSLHCIFSFPSVLEIRPHRSHVDGLCNGTEPAEHAFSLESSHPLPLQLGSYAVHLERFAAS